VSRARRQAGFTVVELLVAMGVLAIVAAGAMTFMQVVMRQGRGVIERTDSAQRGRLVMDTITREIRSQVCLDEATKGLIAASPTELSFYADLSDGSRRPTKRVVRYDPATRRILELVHQPTAAGAYPTQPTTTRVLLENVVPAADESKPAPATLPFFAYFAYPDPLPASPQPDSPLTGTLTAAGVARVAKVDVSFSVRPGSARDDAFVTPLRDAVVLRNADPNATKPDPTCR
jgi:prepilin-type N-terminal cleavage/methylation domain-containing protein